MSIASEESLNNFLMITGCPDRETALRYLESTSSIDEAVNLFFESQEGGSIHAQPSPRLPSRDERRDRSNPFDSGEEDDDFGDDSEVRLTEEEKVFVASREKWVGLEREFKDLSPEKFNILGVFGKTKKGSGEDFNDHNPRFPIKSLPSDLSEVLKFFPMLSDKKLLLAFVQRCQKSTELAKHLLSISAISSLLSNRAAFAGISDQSEQFGALSRLGVKAEDSPCFVFIAYDKFVNLKVLAKVSLSSDPSEGIDLGEIINTMKKVFSDFDQGELEREVFEERVKRKQQELQKRANASPPSNPLANDKKLQMERKLKQEQEDAYHRMVAKHKEEDEKRAEREKIAAAIAESKRVEAIRRSELKERFASRVISADSAFEICLRLPNGSKISKDFESCDQLSLVHDFVSTIESKGFENPDGDFELKSGFPPKILELSRSLSETFPDGSGQLINVVERFVSETDAT